MHFFSSNTPTKNTHNIREHYKESNAEKKERALASGKTVNGVTTVNTVTNQGIKTQESFLGGRGRTRGRRVRSKRLARKKVSKKVRRSVRR